MKLQIRLPDNAVIEGGIITLSHNDALEILRDLEFLKPTESVSAKHLADMREIAFSQLSVDHAQGIAAVEKGADIVLASMRRSGQITSARVDDSNNKRVVNIDDGIINSEGSDTGLPDIIVKRSEALADQYGIHGLEEAMTEIKEGAKKNEK